MYVIINSIRTYFLKMKTKHCLIRQYLSRIYPALRKKVDDIEGRVYRFGEFKALIDSHKLAEEEGFPIDNYISLSPSTTKGIYD